MFQAVEIAPSIRDDNTYMGFVEQWTRFLEGVAGEDLMPTIRLTWNSESDRSGQQMISLTMKDDRGEVQFAVPVTDLRNSVRLRDRYYKQFGDLLHKRTRSILTELKQTDEEGKSE